MIRLSDFDVLTFDCYGTLIDWEAGILGALAPWLERAGLRLPPGEILETYAGHEAAVEAEHPSLLYSRVLEEVIRRLSSEWKTPVTNEEIADFGSSVADWPAFPDSTEALRRLSEHYRLVILSNIDHASFAGSAARLGIDFYAVLTAEDVGSYKPSPRNFDYMLSQLGARGHAPERILHTAQSLFHDHVPAKAKGLRTAWIDRRHDQDGWGATPDPGTAVEPDFRFESLIAMAEAREAEE